MKRTSYSRRRLLGGAIAVAMLLSVPLVSVAHADARTEYLIRLLQSSSQFRVRAQAAISLASAASATEVAEALVAAAADEHPAVRAAAAASLTRVADPLRALRALRPLLRDSEAPVRTAAKDAIAALEGRERGSSSGSVDVTNRAAGPPRYYVAVGRPASRVPEFTSADLERFHAQLRERLTVLDGVELAAPQETPAKVRALLRARNLRGFYIDSAVTSVERKPGGGIRVAVSVIVATYPDRAMRAIMQGAATALGGGDPRSQAIAGALKSALSQLPQAMARD